MAKRIFNLINVSFPKLKRVSLPKFPKISVKIPRIKGLKKIGVARVKMPSPARIPKIRIDRKTK
jgi:hypothetical protein